MSLTKQKVQCQSLVTDVEFDVLNIYIYFLNDRLILFKKQINN